MRATVLHARSGRDKFSLGEGHRVYLSMKVENISGREYGLALLEYPYRGTSLIGGGGDCGAIQVTGLNDVPSGSDGTPWGCDEKQSVIGHNEHIVVNYTLGCRASMEGQIGVFTEQLYVVSDGKVRNVTVSFSDVSVQ